MSSPRDVCDKELRLGKDLGELPLKLRHHRVVELIDEALDHVKTTQAHILRDCQVKGAKPQRARRVAQWRLASRTPVVQLPLLGATAPWNRVSSPKLRRREQSITVNESKKLHGETSTNVESSASFFCSIDDEFSKLDSHRYIFSTKKDLKKSKITESKPNIKNEETWNVNSVSPVMPRSLKHSGRNIEEKYESSFPKVKQIRSGKSASSQDDVRNVEVEQSRTLAHPRKSATSLHDVREVSEMEKPESRHLLSRAAMRRALIRTESDKHTREQCLSSNIADYGFDSSLSQKLENKRFLLSRTVSSQERNVRIRRHDTYNADLSRNANNSSESTTGNQCERITAMFSERGRLQLSPSCTSISRNTARLPSITHTHFGGGSLRMENLTERQNGLSDSMDDKTYFGSNREPSAAVRLPPISTTRSSSFCLDDSKVLIRQ